MAVQALDHVVIMVPDLDAAIRDYTELGFTVVAGGSHPTGTHNALIAFADGAYIELIAFERNNPEHRWWAVAQKGGGLIDFCMRTDDLAGDREAFRKTGVEMQIAPGERVRPDGYRLRWTLAQPVPPYAFLAPFLIEDGTPREARVAAQAPLTLRATKEALRRIKEHMSPEEDRNLILMCYMSRDFREGMDAFLNKRPPKWSGE